MLLTYKVGRGRDFSAELRKARQAADFAVRNQSFSSKDEKHIGLKSIIADQILRKYGRNLAIKKARNVNLIIPGQGIGTDKKKHTHVAYYLRYLRTRALISSSDGSPYTEIFASIFL